MQKLFVLFATVVWVADLVLDGDASRDVECHGAP